MQLKTKLQNKFMRFSNTNKSSTSQSVALRKEESNIANDKTENAQRISQLWNVPIQRNRIVHKCTPT